MANKFNAWKIYWDMFRDGDQVIIVDEDDKVHWGKITAHEYTCVLKRLDGSEDEFHWDEIRFICKDGFPVRKLLGADGNKNILKMNTDDTQKIVRTALDQEYHTEKKKKVVFGDPFMIENVQAKIYNAGTIWTPGHANLYEEHVCLKSDDGAEAILWGVPTIFFFE